MNIKKQATIFRQAAFGALAAFTVASTTALAADHGDAPSVAHDQASDLADTYFFLDPNDNTKAIIIGTFHGFIVPAEAVNFGIYDPAIKYRFEVYNDHVNLAPGDVNPKKIKAQKFIDITFDARNGGADPTGVAGKEALEIFLPQTATLQFTGFDGINKKDKFAVPALDPALSGTSPAQAVTTVTAGISAFVGEVDDPFFFDIPGFARTIAGIRKGTLPGDFTTNPTFLGRGRDSFAGYNDLAIALSVPVALLKGSGNKVGVNFVALRHQVEQPTKTGTVKGVGAFKQIERSGNPAVNVVLVPASLKNDYNTGTPKGDAGGEFAGNIVATLTALGTSQANIGILAGVAVTYGDLVILDTTIANSGTGGGNVVGAGFPNGRRLQDDVVDILLFLATGVTPQNGATPGGDNVGANDKTFGNTFPFLAPTQQPFGNGTLDDKTRN